MAEVHKPLGDTQLFDDPRRALVNRVAASEPFANSPRLRKLLLYLVDCALHEPPLPQTEQQVGVAVFNRTAGYDTSADAIVRVQMSEIRKRLKYYFLSAGARESLVVEIPRGSYLPVFVHKELPEAPVPQEAQHANGTLGSSATDAAHEQIQNKRISAPATPRSSF